MPRRPEYLNKTAASKRSGVSVRRLLELAHRGSIQKIYGVDPKTKRRIALFAATDLARVKARQLPEFKLEMMHSGDAVQHPDHGGIYSRLTKPTTEGINGESRALWMTLEAAANYSGLPENFLYKLIKENILPAFDVGVRLGGRYRVRRLDLDNLSAPLARPGADPL